MSGAGKRNLRIDRFLPGIRSQPPDFILSGSIFLLHSMLVAPLVSSSPIPTPQVGHSKFSSVSLYPEHRKFVVQVVAATCAAMSMAAAFIAFYWFCRMEKHFRHRLIILLIYGDLMKATWLFIFSIVSIARGTVPTESSFCQASGFLVQYGTETSDYAVLVIAVHSALQVFRPSTSVRSDGLYPLRRCIYVAGLLVPAMMAGLAFVNPHYGYLSQGALCTLPLRPFWYRLALAWIPRYLIATIILGLAVAIYTHVGFEFRSFSTIGESVKLSVSTTTPILFGRDIEDGAPGEARSSASQQIPSGHRASPALHNIAACHRTLAGSPLTETTTSISNPLEQAGRFQSVTPSPPRIADSEPSANNTGNDSHDTSPLSTCPITHVQRRLARERSRIHRQLRLMFIYPLVYILMWIVPFASHCLMYQDKWAAHPLYWLGLTSTICVTLMGAVDCLIFSLRERPWLHIPTSGGKFWGSFFCWRRAGESDVRRSQIGEMHRMKTEADFNPPLTIPRPTLTASLSRVKQSATTSKAIDQRKSAADMTWARLEVEKEDRRIVNREGGGQTRRQSMEGLDSSETNDTNETSTSSEKDGRTQSSREVVGGLGSGTDAVVYSKYL